MNTLVLGVNTDQTTLHLTSVTAPQHGHLSLITQWVGGLLEKFRPRKLKSRVRATLTLGLRAKID